MLKNVLKILIVFIVGICGGIFADQILWPYFIERPLFLKYKLTQSPIYVTEKKEIRIQENVALKEAIEKVEKAVVGVRVKTKNGKTIEGSGLILTTDGLIVTLAELIPKDANLSIFVEEELVPWQVLKRDSKENLILIKVEKGGLKTVSFLDLEKMKLGERVFLVGKVFEGKKIKTSVNEGIVKKFDEEKIETNIFEKENLAGSPLFDIEGNFLGLNKLEKDGKIVSIPNVKIKKFAGL